jgi:hypothetical protein
MWIYNNDAVSWVSSRAIGLQYNWLIQLFIMKCIWLRMVCVQVCTNRGIFSSKSGEIETDIYLICFQFTRIDALVVHLFLAQSKMRPVRDLGFPSSFRLRSFTLSSLLLLERNKPNWATLAQRAWQRNSGVCVRSCILRWPSTERKSKEFKKKI